MPLFFEVISPRVILTWPTHMAWRLPNALTMTGPSLAISASSCARAFFGLGRGWLVGGLRFVLGERGQIKRARALPTTKNNKNATRDSRGGVFSQTRVAPGLSLSASQRIPGTRLERVQEQEQD